MKPPASLLWRHVGFLRDHLLGLLAAKTHPTCSAVIQPYLNYLMQDLTDPILTDLSRKRLLGNHHICKYIYLNTHMDISQHGLKSGLGGIMICSRGSWFSSEWAHRTIATFNQKIMMPKTGFMCSNFCDRDPSVSEQWWFHQLVFMYMVAPRPYIYLWRNKHNWKNTSKQPFWGI